MNKFGVKDCYIIMQKITIIIGLPGSGKSTYISSNEEFRNSVICDDYHKSSYKKSREFIDSIYFEDLKKGLLGGKNIVISDIAFCKSDRLNKITENIMNLIAELEIKAHIEYRYFENDPYACIDNILRRNRVERVEREIEFINMMSSQYHIPEDAIMIPVYKP
ncbi:MAG: hypothetical protein V4665_03135 [Patescibacteria group bacterium]